MVSEQIVTKIEKFHSDKKNVDFYVLNTYFITKSGKEVKINAYFLQDKDTAIMESLLEKVDAELNK